MATGTMVPTPNGATALRCWPAHSRTLAPQMKIEVAASNRKGTNNAKAVFEDTSNRHDPITPPNSVQSVSRMTSARSICAISCRKPSAADRYPGRAATVLVALAATTGTPLATKAGKVMKVPPPATAFSIPPKNPAQSISKVSVMPGLSE